MRPKTRSSGMPRTKRSRPVRVRTLTRMFVPKPKSAFQSPGTQTLGRWREEVIMEGNLKDLVCCSSESGEDFPGVGNPAEDAALGFDHRQSGGVVFGKIGRDAVGRDEA